MDVLRSRHRTAAISLIVTHGSSPNERSLIDRSSRARAWGSADVSPSFEFTTRSRAAPGPGLAPTFHLALVHFLQSVVITGQPIRTTGAVNHGRPLPSRSAGRGAASPRQALRHVWALRRPVCLRSVLALGLVIGACGDDEEELGTTIGTTPTGGAASETDDGATTSDSSTAGSDGSGGSDPTSDGDSSETESDTNGDSWWFEIDALGFDRGEGTVVVIVGPQIQADSLGENGEFSLSIVGVPGEPGSYEALSILGFHDESEPQHRCLTGDPTITLEVSSVEPFEATFSGTVECWEGDELLPKDQNGQTLPSTVGNVSGYIYMN